MPCLAIGTLLPNLSGQGFGDLCISTKKSLSKHICVSVIFVQRAATGADIGELQAHHGMISKQ